MQCLSKLSVPPVIDDNVQPAVTDVSRVGKYFNISTVPVVNSCQVYDERRGPA